MFWPRRTTHASAVRSMSDLLKGGCGSVLIDELMPCSPVRPDKLCGWSLLSGLMLAGMEIVSAPRFADGVPGIPRKPLDNPPRPKPTYASDEECARLLDAVVRRVPADLHGLPGSRFPLLDALEQEDRRDGTELATQLVCIAAVNHDAADERATAEYLLRNRAEVASDQRSALALLLAARCAAEMDVRRVGRREVATSHEALATWAASRPVYRIDDPSVGEMVIHKLRMVTRGMPNPVVAERILDAVPIALDLAERHSLKGGKGPSLLGMRSDARKQSRLVTHLRVAFDNDVAARNVARLLVGADGTPIESALLWWSARADLVPSDVPVHVRDRWMRYLRTTESAISTTATLSTGLQRRIDEGRGLSV
jgi:hypothetical protein